MAALAGNLDRDVRKPAVGLCAVPVPDIGGNHDHAARRETDRRLALLLIPALAGRADEQLAAAPGGVMDVPVVAAARLEGNIVNGNLLAGNSCQLTVAFEILGIGGVWLANGENHLLL